MDSNVYVHGGFEHETPNIPIDAIAKIDASKLFVNHQNLASKIYPKAANKKPAGDGSKGANKKNSNMYNIGDKEDFKLAN